MLIKYVTNATSTAAQIAADLAKLCAGADISTLSASCDKVNSTTIYNSVAAGWTVLDAAGPSNSVVISAMDADNLRAKYVGIGAYSTTQIYMTGYDTYNATNHTGTLGVTVLDNTPAATYNTGTVKTVSITTSNVIYLFVTPRYIFIAWGDGVTILFHAEYTRDVAYLANNANYSPVVFGSEYLFSQTNVSGNGAGSGSVIGLRGKNMITVGDVNLYNASNLTNKLRLGTISNGIIISTGSSETTLRDANDNIYHLLVPITVSQRGNSSLFQLGNIRDIQLATKSQGSFGDTVSDGVTNYFIISPNVYGARLAIPAV